MSMKPGATMRPRQFTRVAASLSLQSPMRAILSSLIATSVVNGCAAGAVTDATTFKHDVEHRGPFRRRLSCMPVMERASWFASKANG